MKRMMLISMLLATVAALAVIGIVTANQQAPCSGPANLTPIGQFANIRTGPAITAALAGQLQRSASAHADTLSGGWWQLSEGAGYIRADVVKAECVEATPTRQPTATPPSAEVKEQHIICPSACEIVITIEGLP